MKKRFLSMLVLLMAVSGAMAQTETLLTTITGAGSTSNPATSANVSYSTEGVATLTFSEPTLDGNVAYQVSPAWGWWGYDMTLTVTPAEGYTITKCIFYDDANRTATDSEAPFVVETTKDDKTPKVNGKPIKADTSKGITKIEVYGYTYSVTLAEGTEDADKWTIEPKTGLKGGETVTATYSGEKKVKSVKAVKKVVDPLAVPLTIEAITAGTIQVAQPKEGMQYSLNGGAKTTMSITTTIDVAAGDKVQFYGNGTSITSYDGTKITSNGDGFTCKVYGNIMSLVDEENFATATTLSATNTFRSLFSNFTTLTDASGLLLPATQLAGYCYYSMFQGCTALTAAPALPATTLATNCYQQMFQGCTALTASPVLPAPTLVSRCYQQMFYYCQKLATVTCLATSGMGLNNSTNNWLQSAGTEAEDTKTVYTSSAADWPSNNNGIPSGWTRVDVDN